MAVTRQRAPIDQSELKWRHTDPDQGPPYTLHFDCHISRRKRFHMMTDKAGGVVFRSRLAGDMLDWLAQRGETAYMLEAEGDSYRAEITLTTRQKESQA